MSYTSFSDIHVTAISCTGSCRLRSDFHRAFLISDIPSLVKCLSMRAGNEVELPAPLMHDGRQVGTLTSAVESLEGDRVYGLGYVRKAHANEGARLLTESGIEVLVEGFPC